MTASEHTTGSDSLEHRMHPPKSGTTTARQPPVRNPLRDFPGIPRLTYSTRKRPYAAENSPIRNKLLGRQTHRGEPIARRYDVWGRVHHSENALRSEEHTSELQSLRHLVCRLLLE